MPLQKEALIVSTEELLGNPLNDVEQKYAPRNPHIFQILFSKKCIMDDETAIELSDHALEKLQSHKIKKEQVIETISSPDSLFHDVESDALIAIKLIRGKHIVVVYSKRQSIFRIVTAYHSTKVDRLMSRKQQRGAWLERRPSS